MKIIAIILLGGSSSRFEYKTAKQFFDINGKPVECPILSVAFYNGDDKKKIFNQKIGKLKESTENKLDFYKKYKEKYITSLDIEIENQEDFEKACKNVIKFADDKIQQIINTLAKTK